MNAPRKPFQTRFVDGYTVFKGEITGGPADGLQSCGITFFNNSIRKKFRIAMPAEMAIQLAHDILQLAEDEDEDEPV